MPVPVGHALVKVLMLALAVLTVRGVAARLRVTRGGVAHRLSPGSLRVLTLLFAVLLLAGVQLQHSFRNSWVSYPVLTMGAIAVLLGSVWAALAASDALARGSRTRVVAVPALVLLGLALALSYEMYFVVGPLIALALVLHAPGGLARTPSARRAKLVAGAAVLVPFGAMLAWTRLLVSRVCGDPDASCYAGTETALGPGRVATAVRNLVGAVPGHGLAGSRERAGTRIPPEAQDGAFSAPSLLLITLVLAGIALLLPWLRRRSDTDSDPQAERPVLVALGLIALAMSAGTATIMAGSTQAQELITATEFPYRHTVTTWAGLALALAALATLGLGLPRTAGRVVVGALPVVVVVLWTVGVVYPVNATLTRSALQSENHELWSEAHRSVLNPRLDETGEEQRCALLARVNEALDEDPLSWYVRLRPGMTGSFELLWDRPYCADPRPGTG